jgi:hypothetical protein
VVCPDLARAVVDVAFQVLVWHRAALGRNWIIGNEQVGFIDPVRAISALPASGARLPFGGAARDTQSVAYAWRIVMIRALGHGCTASRRGFPRVALS